LFAVQANAKFNKSDLVRALIAQMFFLTK